MLYSHTSLSPCVGGRLNLAWAISAVKQICELLVEKNCLAFFKIYLKIHFITSNSQICFIAKTGHAKFSLPPMRGLKLVCIREIFRRSGYFNRTMNCFKRLPGFEINFDQYSGIVVDYSKRNYKINSN